MLLKLDENMPNFAGSQSSPQFGGGGGGSGLIGGLIGSVQDEVNVWRDLQVNRYYMKKDRQWVADREDSAVRRRIADLKAAGLNPMLGYIGQASSAQPQATRMDSKPSSFGSGSQSVASAKLIAAQTGLITAQKENIEASTAAHLGSAGQARAHTDLIRASIPKIVAEIRSIDAGRALTETHMVVAALDAQQKAAIMPSMIRLLTNDAYRSDLGLPRAENMSSMEKTWWGRVRHYLPDLGPIIGGVIGAKAIAK